MTVSIVLEDADSGGMLSVYLGGTCWRADDAYGPGNGADASRGRTDVLRGRTDAPNASSTPETACVSHSEGAGTYLGTGVPKRLVNATDGTGIHADTSCVRMDAQSVGVDTQTAGNETKNVRTRRTEEKMQNSPSRAAKRAPDEPDGCREHADASTVRTDAYSVETDTETAANKAESVRTRRIGRKTRNSPDSREITMPDHSCRWRKVSVDGVDVYVPRNVPVEVSKTANRTFAFGEVECRGEAIAPSVEGERAGDGDGRRDGGEQINARNISRAQDHETTHLDLTHDAQPHGNVSKHCYGVHRPRRQRDRIKIVPRKLKIERLNDKKQQNGETTYLGCTGIVQPPGNPPNRPYGVHTTHRRRGRIKFGPANVSRTQEIRNAYLGRGNAFRSRRRPKKDVRRSDKLTFNCRKQGERLRGDGDYG